MCVCARVCVCVRARGVQTAVGWGARAVGDNLLGWLRFPCCGERKRPCPHSRVRAHCPLQGSVKIFAKDLVRTKRSIQKFHQMGAQLRALEIRITVSAVGRG